MGVCVRERDGIEKTEREKERECVEKEDGENVGEKKEREFE